MIFVTSSCDASSRWQDLQNLELLELPLRFQSRMKPAKKRKKRFQIKNTRNKITSQISLGK
jgi:hypothetical protein